MRDDKIVKVIRAYDSFIVRSYCLIRFHILRERFLDEIGQYLPEEGRVLDIGCGFGLFSLYYAQRSPGLHIHGLDLSARRVAMARSAASRLGITNVSYEVGDASTHQFGGTWDGAYMLDLVHHVPKHAVRPILEQFQHLVRPGCRLVIKDVGRAPAYKRWFTHWLDKLMSPRTRVHYWGAEELHALLAEVGFRVYRHAMVDYLPYPHVLFICERRE